MSFTVSWSLLKFMSSECMMLSNYLILCYSLLLLPSIFSSIRVFSNESSLHIMAPKFWSFSISPSVNSQSLFPLGLTGLNSLLCKGLTKISPASQFESINSSAFSLLYGPTLTSRDITLPKKERLLCK